MKLWIAVHRHADGAGKNRGTDWIVDVSCKHCGRLGSLGLDPDEVQF